MCCPGCQTVAGAIVAGGLENYYQYRSALAVKADEVQRKDKNYFRAFDDRVLQQSFVVYSSDEKQPEAKLAEVQLYIEGIHCAACCWLIEHALQKKAGVKSISVSLATHKALLCWDTNQHLLSELLQCVHDVGYEALPYQPELARQQQEKERRTQLLRLGIAGIGMMQAMMFAIALYSGDFSGIDAAHKQFMRCFSLIVTVPVLFYSAAPFFKNAWRNIRSFHAGMDLPVSLALLIAFVASLHAVAFKTGEVYFDSISMFVFLLLLARYAESSVRRRLVDFSGNNLPLTCECLADLSSSRVEVKAVNKIEAGQIIRIKAGENIPLDGIVLEGNSSVNESAFSGEQQAVNKTAGDVVFAGTIDGDGVLTLRVTTTAGQTRLDMITRLSEWSQAQKPRVSVIADQFASIFTIVVLLLAACAGIYWHLQGSTQTFAIVLSILVVSCPCALSLATPSALACCYQALRKNGLLVNSNHMIEQSRHITHIIFDKTGTLTRGNFSISRTHALSIKEPAALELAAALERYSEHPLAAAFQSIATDIALTDVQTFSGKGVEGVWQGERYRIGSLHFCAELAGITVPENVNQSLMDLSQIILQRVYLVKNQQWLAAFDLKDALRPEVKSLVEHLKQLGKQVEILSGDASGAAEQIATQCGITVCHSAMTPEGKLEYISHLQAQGHRVLMVGDGINDIPVLAKANLSIAMSHASDLAKIKADAILLGNSDNASLLPIRDLLRHTEKARRVIAQNISWALLYNGIALPLAAMGLVSPWMAALGMSVSSLVVTFNSLRLCKIA